MPATEAKFSAAIDVQRVRRLFNSQARCAASNFLRREIASRMSERLDLMKIAPQAVLDAGCGEGADLNLLQSRFPQARIIGIDASANMLRAALTQGAAAPMSFAGVNRWLAKLLPGKSSGGPALLCGDFAQLPLNRQTVDVIWSNLALHWHPCPEQVFAEWRRVLRLDGLLLFSCFGPDTFKQLRSAFACVDALPHVLPFVDMHDFGDMLGEAGFATPVMDMETITVTYDRVDKLLADARAWGGNPLATRRRGLLGRKDWLRVTDALEQMRQADGKIPLTFEIVYGHAFRAASKVTAAGETIVRLDFPQKRF